MSVAAQIIIIESGGPVLNLSGSSVADTASVGTTVGTLSVSGGSGTYTFTLTSNPGSLFSISGSALQVAASLSAGSDAITIKADNGAGSVITQPFLITATHAPANTVAPSISGSAVDGATLTAASGTWTGSPPPTLTYQWKRAGSPITGATNTTYVAQLADVGSALTVTVTGTNGIGSPASATSSATASVTKTTLSYSPVTSAANGSAYTGATPSPSGGTSPYAYSISAGTLPTGTSLNASTGVISGTPTVNAAYSGIVLTVTDANGITDSSSPFTITVSNFSIQLSASSFPESSAQTTAIGTLSVVGGTGTYTFTLTDSHTNAAQVAGTNGVNLQAGSASSGIGSFNITVHADNGAGSTLDQTFSISALPKVPTLVDLTAISDAGSSSTDNITNINTPSFDIVCSSTPVAGDVIDIAKDGTIVKSITLASGDISGTTAQGLGLTALTDGTYSFTARHTRSGLSSAFSAGTSVTIDTIAPVLSSPTGAQAAQTTASLGVTTNDSVGTLYVVVTGSATPPTAAQIQAGFDNTGSAALYAANQTISSTGAKTATATGLSSIQTDHVYWMHQDVAGNQSNVVTASWAQADITAPTLTSPSGSSASTTTANLSVSTNEANGTLYWVVTTSATPPSVAQVKAGQDNTGSAAAASGNQAVSGTGAQTATASGLTPSSTVFAYFVHTDAANNNSTVSASSSWNQSGAITFAITNSGASSYAENNTAQTTYTFTGVAIGAADANRYVALEFGIRSTAAISISSVSVDSGSGPVFCTKVVQKDVASNNDTSIWQTNSTIPLGTTATIVIVITNAAARACVFAHRIITSSGIVPSGTAIATYGGAAPHAVTLVVPAGGGAIIAAGVVNSGGSHAPTNYTEDHDAAVAASTYIFTTGSDTTHSGSTVYTCTPSPDAAISLVGAAWGP